MRMGRTDATRAARRMTVIAVLGSLALSGAASANSSCALFKKALYKQVFGLKYFATRPASAW
ncbi:MAG TPA: hypothetical protein VMU39_28220 [Solirubrobacteraceae bacterium]|nr:hypothetical protein [Solirubrobacteraceae bacterium]